MLALPDHALRLLAVLLLVTIGAVHYAPAWLAVWLVSEPNAAPVQRALHYVAQGLKGIALLGVIVLLLPRRRAALPVALVCIWGVAEDALVAGCRLARGITQPAGPGLWEGVCRQVTSAPTNFIGPVLAAVAAAAILWEFDHARRAKRR
jgi:hypothetical protein